MISSPRRHQCNRSPYRRRIWRASHQGDLLLVELRMDGTLSEFSCKDLQDLAVMEGSQRCTINGRNIRKPLLLRLLVLRRSLLRLGLVGFLQKAVKTLVAMLDSARSRVLGSHIACTTSPAESPKCSWGKSTWSQ